MSGIIFLRVLVPCVAAPAAFAILPSVPPRQASRGLVLVSKIVNAMVNAVLLQQPFSEVKEPFMLPLTDVVAEHLPSARDFFRKLCAKPPRARTANAKDTFSTPPIEITMTRTANHFNDAWELNDAAKAAAAEAAAK